MNSQHPHAGTAHKDTVPHDARSPSHYGRLLVMVALSFASMYALMYAMVNARQNVYLNVNQFYMAGLMTAPMVLVEIVLMGSMYRHRKANAVIILASLVVLAGFWVLIRKQTAVGDQQFLRSMIPHHAGALLMCEEAAISDPEIKALCESIKAGQQAEIDQMKRALARLKGTGSGGNP